MTELNDNNFDAEVLQAQGVAIVDFWAVWCAPCRMLAPVIEGIADEFAGTVKVCKMDVDGANDVPARFGIRSIPTVLFFKDGQLVDRTVGAVSKAVIVDKLNALL